VDFKVVTDFENKLANFFGAPYCVATDSCTHAIELSLRYTTDNHVVCPKHTYISIPFTFEKLTLDWSWRDIEWQDYYFISDKIIDAAVYWKQNGYIPGSLMCVSFQIKKHLGLGRGGCILTDNKESYNFLKSMSYDGRNFEHPRAEQNISRIGYHYYMTPEIAQKGLKKLSKAINTKPKSWCYEDYPNLTKMAVFK